MSLSLRLITADIMDPSLQHPNRLRAQARQKPAAADMFLQRRKEPTQAIHRYWRRFRRMVT